MNALLYDLVAEAVKAQPWYRKNANTIVAGLTLLGTALSFIIALELDLPPVVTLALPIAVQTVGTFATKLTVNGMQLNHVDKLAATPAAARLTSTPFLPTADVVTAEIQRTAAHVQGQIDTHVPAIAAELDRIHGAVTDAVVDLGGRHHRLEE